jgi:hypothetical protein
MAVTGTTAVDALVRLARLVVAVLLLGGMVAGPVAHLGGADAPAGPSSHAHHDPGVPPAPDLHHDCPVCITLAGASAPVAPTVSVSAAVTADRVTTPVGNHTEREGADLSCARAPPHA